MGDALQQALSPGSWPTFAFVLTRTGGFMTVAPLWSLAGIPRRVRAAVTAVIGVVLLPSAQRITGPETTLQLPGMLSMEFMVGLAIGLTAAVLVHGVMLAGEVLAIQMGLSLGPAASPMPELAVPGIGQLKSFLALLIYLGVGGHLMLLRGLADSLRVLPPGTGLVMDRGGEMIVELLGTVFVSAIHVAAPAMVALLLTHVVVAITGRAVPQVHAILLAFPLTIGIGLLMIGASLPIVGASLTGWMTELPERTAQVIQFFHQASGRP